MALVVYVQQLDAALITRWADIFTQEKRIDLFASRQPDGLMTQLMDENIMRKDGFEHQEERRKIFPSLSPRTVTQVWKTEFERSTQVVIEGLRQKQIFDWYVIFHASVGRSISIDHRLSQNGTSKNGSGELSNDRWLFKQYWEAQCNASLPCCDY